MVTGSWDGGIRLWDVESALTLSQAKTSSPVLGMTRPTPVVASGHSDYAIRLWDSRAPDSVRSLTAHRAIPAALSWLSGSLRVNEETDVTGQSALPLLASADYNGTIKVWDLRASVPLVSLSRAHNKGLPSTDSNTNAVKAPPHKVLSMTAFRANNSPQHVVTGGTDNRALIHRL
jgi:WD40 repeat protein